ncbi:MAG: copper oxidase [Planctomycetaceae bacterium]|nr:copper oxidase [Planctomycetaceae bacterium]
MPASRQTNPSSDPSAAPKTRRSVLKAGAGVLAGAALAGVDNAHGQLPTAPATTATSPATTAQTQRTKYDRYLHDTRNDAWRAKVLEGESLERQLTRTERIDPARPLPPGLPGQDYLPVITPNNVSLPFKIVDGVKVFHLVAQEIRHQFAPGIEAFTWGYNGRVNGPTIEVVEGDRVRIYLTNHLPAPTSLHPHGFLLPNGLDGVSGLTNPPALPGETFKIEFTIRQHGTFMYHSHHDTMTQEGMGLTGMVVMHPRRQLHTVEEIGLPVDRDFVILLQEWRVEVGAHRINPFSMDFNLFTMNGVVFPATEPLVARLGQRVRLRFGNLSPIDHHPIHLHGYEFAITAHNGFRVPPAQQVMQVTALIPVGRTQEWELLALNPGDWIFHCHMTHHTMNQMNHLFTNLVGVAPGETDKEIQQLLPNYMTMATGGMNDRTGRPMHPIPPNSIPMKNEDGPFGPITFGGMTSLFKVRAQISDEDLARNADPGWYDHPPAEIAQPATGDELRRDGINPSGASRS